MAIYLSSLVGFNSTAKYHHLVSSRGIGTSVMKVNHFSPPSGFIALRRPVQFKNLGSCLSVANGDHITAGTSENSSTSTSQSYSDDGSSAVNPSSSGSSTTDDKFQTNAEVELGPQTSKVSNGSFVSSDPKADESFADFKTTPKRSPLTAREKLRAARVLSRYMESKSKASKPELGSKVLEALRESDVKEKKKSGLPEAPTNLFDDNKRGLPKQGLTFEFPGGFDFFIILFSFVFISTVMFATTYIVWKVGAIHFNEY